MAQSQYVVVVGCGRLGSILACRLSSQGNSVVVIDPNEVSFNNLNSEFSGFQITGDASELSVLRSAKADKADCLLAVTDRDNINLMVAQIAKNIFQVSTVLARVFGGEDKLRPWRYGNENELELSNQMKVSSKETI